MHHTVHIVPTMLLMSQRKSRNLTPAHTLRASSKSQSRLLSPSTITTAITVPRPLKRSTLLSHFLALQSAHCNQSPEWAPRLPWKSSWSNCEKSAKKMPLYGADYKHSKHKTYTSKIPQPAASPTSIPPTNLPRQRAKDTMAVEPYTPTQQPAHWSRLQHSASLMEPRASLLMTAPFLTCRIQLGLRTRARATRNQASQYSQQHPGSAKSQQAIRTKTKVLSSPTPSPPMLPRKPQHPLAVAIPAAPTIHKLKTLPSSLVLQPLLVQLLRFLLLH